MSFLDPGMAAWAVGLTVPPLIALYFLKLKRNVKMVPSTLLWKRAVEDLQVNAPFQRLRSSLLLLLQLLVLLLAALALGKPMFQSVQSHEGTAIILIDQSASMGVVEVDGRTRLDIAKEQAKRTVDNLADDARAMVIAFCDRATVVSSFDTNKDALKRKIDSIEPTQSRSSLAEAITLAEANTQNMIIGQEEGPDLEITSAPAPAAVFLFTDGRIEDAGDVVLKRLQLDKIRMTVVGQRTDNVGLVSMDARRNYEIPEVLEVTATVRNFGPAPVTLDAVLYVDGNSLDVQTIQLAPAAMDDEAGGNAQPPVGSVKVVAFDEVEFGGGGLVEVMLRVQDALPADDRAWTVIDPPRNIRALLVTPGNMFLENALATLPIEVVKMTGADYEAAGDDVIADGERSAYDVVVFDRHSTSRLPHGNYLFFGAIPQIEGVEAGRMIDNEVIFNWDEAHPVLRHASVENLYVIEWLDLKLPPEAVPIVDGETSSVLAYLARQGSQFLICAFPLITENSGGLEGVNTPWVVTVDFVVFIQNAVSFLAANIAAEGERGIAPGEPVTMPLPPKTQKAVVHRPDGKTDTVSVGGFQTVFYARTRQVGPYRLEPGVRGHDLFAVNLFNPVESHVAPAPKVTLGAELVVAQAGSIEVNQPAWPYVMLAMLAMLLLEWIVYNRRVFV